MHTHRGFCLSIFSTIQKCTVLFLHFLAPLIKTYIHSPFLYPAIPARPNTHW